MSRSPPVPTSAATAGLIKKLRDASDGLSSEAADMIEALVSRQKVYAHHLTLDVTLYAVEENFEDLSDEQILTGCMAMLADLERDGSDVRSFCTHVETHLTETASRPD